MSVWVCTQSHKQAHAHTCAHTHPFGLNWSVSPGLYFLSPNLNRCFMTWPSSTYAFAKVTHPHTHTHTHKHTHKPTHTPKRTRRQTNTDTRTNNTHAQKNEFQQMADVSNSIHCVCVAACCIVLQYVAVRCRYEPFTSMRIQPKADVSNLLRDCSVLQCVALCCSALQCVAAYCSLLQYVAVCCSMLQYVAVCCSMLQT